MDRKLIQTINRSLGKVKTVKLSKVTIDSMQARLTEELDWFDADPGRVSCLRLLYDLASKAHSEGVVMSPGYSFLTDSFVLYLAGIHSVNPVEWDLPFSRFIKGFHDGNTIPVEGGTGIIEVAQKVFSGRDEIIVETEPGVFDVTFLDGDGFDHVIVKVIHYATLDRFQRTLKNGWRPLDEATLRLFSFAPTDDTLWFESDKMREWLFEFEPETMSDLCLLNAIYYPGRIELYDTILQHKQNPDSIVTTGNPKADQILKYSYGVLVYQEQALHLKEAGFSVKEELKNLALQGHTIARTMLSVEIMADKKKHPLLE